MLKKCLLFDHLRRLRLPLRLIQAFESFYLNIDARSIIDGYPTKTMKYNNGVLQESSYGPVLAILFYDIIVRYLEENQKKLGFKILSKTFVVRAFADDLIELSENQKNAQKLIKATITIFE